MNNKTVEELCRKQACAIQYCLAKHKWSTDKCKPFIDKWETCKKRVIGAVADALVNGAPGAVIRTPWAGLVVSTLPSAIYAVLDALGSVRTALGPTASLLLPFHIMGALGIVWAALRRTNAELGHPFLPVGLACFATLLFLVHDLWYCKSGPASIPESLEEGQTMPDFAVVDPFTGMRIKASELCNGKGYKAALFVFIQGNWSSVCVAQARELSRVSADLMAAGCNSVIVCTQPRAECKALAEKAAVKVLCDESFEAADALGLRHVNGTLPMVSKTHHRDTVHPAQIVVGPDRRICFTEVNPDCRDRTAAAVLLFYLQQSIPDSLPTAGGPELDTL